MGSTVGAIMPSKFITNSCVILCYFSLIACITSFIVCIKTHAVEASSQHKERIRRVRIEKELREDTLQHEFEMEENLEEKIAKIYYKAIDAEIIFSGFGIFYNGLCLFGFSLLKEETRRTSTILIWALSYMIIHFIMFNSISIYYLCLTGFSAWFTVAPNYVILYLIQIPYHLLKISLLFKCIIDISREKGKEPNQNIQIKDVCIHKIKE